MKKLLLKIWEGIKSLWKKANDEVKEHAVAAVNIVEAIKNFNDSDAANFIDFVLDTVTAGATTPVTEKVREFIRKQFPKLLLELKIIQSIADLTDDNEKLKAILAELKVSSVNGILYKGIAGKALEYLEDGEWSFDDSVNLVTYWYQQTQLPKYKKAAKNGTGKR